MNEQGKVDRIKGTLPLGKRDAKVRELWLGLVAKYKDIAATEPKYAGQKVRELVPGRTDVIFEPGADDPDFDDALDPMCILNFVKFPPLRLRFRA